MTLTELRYIVAVAQKRHFGRAAEACFVSQPTLSVAVRRLEEELGVVLFERARGEVKLTPAGERVVEQARRALAETEAIKEIALASRDELAGPLRLGAIYTIGPYLLPQLIPLVHERAPQMPLLVEENYTVELAARLKRGELDVIIVALPFDEPGILTLPLYTEPFVAVVPVEHPLADQQAVSLTELGQQTVLLLGPGHCFRDQVLSACPQCAPDTAEKSALQQALAGASLETIRLMVASGVGVTVLPCSAVSDSRHSDRLLCVRPFSGWAPNRRVALAWRGSFPRPRAIELLADMIRQTPIGCVKMAE